MGKELKTIKVSERTVKNLNIAAALDSKKQWEIAEQASIDILAKISAKTTPKKP